MIKYLVRKAPVLAAPDRIMTPLKRLAALSLALCLLLFRLSSALGASRSVFVLLVEPQHAEYNAQ